MINKFYIPELYRNLYGYTDFYSIEDDGPELLIQEAEQKNLLGADIIMPLKLSLPHGEMWELPVEVLVSVKGSHRRIDRYPLRGSGQGSHKERWSMDDYQVSIKGVLINLENGTYPEVDSLKLRSILETGQAKVEGKLFRIWGIDRVVFDDWDIPFTEGVPLQEFSISGKSDKLFDSLLTEA